MYFTFLHAYKQDIYTNRTNIHHSGDLTYITHIRQESALSFLLCGCILKPSLSVIQCVCQGYNVDVPCTAREIPDATFKIANE